jgi:hypothetical protein
LRDGGGADLDPARFRYLEALSRRLDGQPQAVVRLLQDKLQAALADYARRLAQAQPAAGDDRGLRRRPARAGADAACAPLAQLNAYIRDATSARLPAAPGEARQQGELASAQRFRQAWASHRSHDQVEQAVSRKPANAGPLNSHALVLHSLALMRELSPDYLRRFLAHVEALQWLDQAGEKQRQRTAAPAAPAKARSRRKK